MGQKAQTVRSRRGHITIDWMVLAVACIAILFLVGTMMRTAVDADAVISTGYQELGGDDTLLAFQDFSFDADGWMPAATSDRLPGLGPVLGPFRTEPVQRTFPISMAAASAQVTFDLHLVGDWAQQGEFHVALDETEVLTISLPDPTDLSTVELQVAEADGVNVAVQSTFVRPRSQEPALRGANDDANDDFVTLRIRLGVSNPNATLTLRLNADVETEARWTLDNLVVVATSGDRAARQ